MMHKFKLNDTEYMALIVPEDAHGFVYGNHCIGFKSEQDWEIKDSNDFCLIELGLFGGKNHILIGVYNKWVLKNYMPCSDHEKNYQVAILQKIIKTKKY